ncbi:MAG: DUF1150 family protein [Alphaproteobacteria bacterium]|nr:DUF1150 family protein [Alphaproteobacteria bacterium]
MNATDSKKLPDLSAVDLARLGGGALGYIREIVGDEVTRLLGERPRAIRGTKLFCLYHADGTPISVSGSLEAAIGSAAEHELMAMSVH